MCSVCRSTPCLDRCPNAAEDVAEWCSQCGEGICVGEEFLCEWEPICASCLDNMTQAELLEHLGYSMTIAEKETEDDDHDRYTEKSYLCT